MYCTAVLVLVSGLVLVSHSKLEHKVSVRIHHHLRPSLYLYVCVCVWVCVWVCVCVCVWVSYLGINVGCLVEVIL